MIHPQQNNLRSLLAAWCAPFLLALFVAIMASSNNNIGTLAAAQPSGSSDGGMKSAMLLSATDNDNNIEQQQMEKRWSDGIAGAQQQRFAFAKRRAFAFAKRANNNAWLEEDAGGFGGGSRFAFAKRAGGERPADLEFADKRFAFAYGPRRFAFAKRATGDFGGAYRNFAFA